MDASSESIDHTALLREFPAPSTDILPGVVGFDGSEGHFTHLPGEKTVARRYLARHSLGIQQFSGNDKLDNDNWLPGAENLADGPAMVTCEMAPLQFALQPGSFCPGVPRPLRGV